MSHDAQSSSWFEGRGLGAGPGAWRSIAEESRRTRPVLEGLDRWACYWQGGHARRTAHEAGWLERAEAILQRARSFSGEADERLASRLEPWAHRARLGTLTPEGVDGLVALLTEAVRRVLGFELYPVQIAAALGLQGPNLIEMATGEGKTVTATIAAGVHATWGRGCHVVTVNDYLAARDAEQAASVLGLLGLTVGCIQAGDGPSERRQAYRADVTYGTHKELAADFLRDRLTLGGIRSPAAWVLQANRAKRPVELVTRGFGAAIVDEADSVLIDDAQTPLLISRQMPNPPPEEALRDATAFAELCQAEEDFTVEPVARRFALTERGDRAARDAAEQGALRSLGQRVALHLIHNALKARLFFRRDDEYVIQDGKVVIVDEATGRRMEDRTWRDGVHQAVESKEGLPLSPATETSARVSFQRYFARYPRLAGMSGTAWEARAELFEVYRLAVLRLPSHRPCLRRVDAPRLFQREEEKWRAVVAETCRVHAQGRPVLLGTRSVKDSGLVSALLHAAGVAHTVLNALQDQDEARVIAEAGLPGCITVATNMAGRGTDIRLGEGVADQGGLHVIAAQLHPSGRVDRQLQGRAGRQGDPGSTACFASLEDELFRLASGSERAWLRRVADRGAIGPLESKLIHSLQRRAERKAREVRRGLLLHEEQEGQSLGFSAD